MRMRRVVAMGLASVGLLVASGCGGDDAESSPARSAPFVPPDAKAVTLRGELDSLVSEHVFLVAEAVNTGSRAGFESALFSAARKELDRSTRKLAAALAPIFEGGTQRRFEDQLVRLDDLLVAYGREQVTPGSTDQPLRAEIEDARSALAALLGAASERLDEADVGEVLDLTLDELLVALDHAAEDARGGLEHTSTAAHRSRALAAMLAEAVAAQDPAITHSPVAQTARVHADLRTLLEEDVHLSFAAVQVAFARGFGAPRFVAASRAVDRSAGAIADRFVTIEGVDGDRVSVPDLDPAGEGDDAAASVELRRAVQDTLRRHWQLLALYAREAEGDVPGVDSKALEDRLAAVTEALAGVLAKRTDADRASLLEPLDAADKALIKAIDALAIEDPKAYEHLSAALGHVADAADVLTDGVIEREDP